MGVKTPPKYVNRELNSQIGIRSQDSYFSESDGAPPTSMLLWGAIYCVRYIKRDANDSLCINWFAILLLQLGAALPYQSAAWPHLL